jgi:hypothetical protein
LAEEEPDEAALADEEDLDGVPLEELYKAAAEENEVEAEVVGDTALDDLPLEEVLKQAAEEEAVATEVVDDTPLDELPLEEVMKRAAEEESAAISDEALSVEAKAIIQLLETLTELVESLPPEERDAYLESEERTTIEHILITLKNKPSLLKRILEIRQAGGNDVSGT